MNKFRFISVFLILAMLFSFANVRQVSAENQYSSSFDCRVFEYVPEPAGISWDGARLAAMSRSYLGAPGRLATLDSQAVMDHVVAAFPVVSSVAPWIGAYSPTGSSNPNSGWAWISGEPWAFTKWIPGEPSGWSGNPAEGGTLNGAVGWNDVPPVFVQRGYIVEYDVACEQALSPACISVNALPYGGFYANHWAPLAGPYSTIPTTTATISGFAPGETITFWLTTQGHYSAQWKLFSGPTAGGALVAQHTYNGPTTVPNPKSITYVIGSNPNDSTLTQTVSTYGGGMTTAHPSYMTTCASGNLEPTADAGGPYTGSEGSFIAMSDASASDPDVADTLIYAWTVDSALCSFDDASLLNPNLTCNDNGSFSAILSVNDGVNPAVSSDASVTVGNVAPTVAISGNASVDEGSLFSLTLGAVTDPGTDTVSAYTVNWGDGTSDSLLAHTYADGSNNYNITVDLTDEDGTFTNVANAFSVQVDNVAPTLGAISVSTSLVSVNTSFNASASFTDPGLLDTHTAAWDWGDGSSTGSVTQAAGSGSVSDGHIYSTPGVYTIKLTVSDNDPAASNQVSYEYVVVYDPNGGFVTGGGWINSPAGAYTADPTLAGKANFGFVAKYKKGANVPDGNTQFQFKAGDLNFKSSSYEWLVVAGNKAQFKGFGTINGQGSYRFMITADDDSPDTFRIHIWDDNGTIYDNGSQQSLGGGSIAIHK